MISIEKKCPGVAGLEMEKSFRECWARDEGKINYNDNHLTDSFCSFSTPPSPPHNGRRLLFSFLATLSTISLKKDFEMSDQGEDKSTKKKIQTKAQAERKHFFLAEKNQQG